MIEQRGDRTVADTAGMQILTGRPAHTIRVLCERDPDGVYDADACTAVLAEEPTNLVLLTAAQAQQYLELRAGTVRKWANRGKIQAVDRDAAGRPLYSLVDLQRVRGRW